MHIQSEKTCSICQRAKPTPEFKKDARRSYGASSWCLDCARIKGRQRYYRDVEKTRTKSRDHYLKHREERAARERGRRMQMRVEILSHYGNECACCGENRQEFLCVDHVNGDGSKHRKEVSNGTSGTAFYWWIRRNNFPEGLRLLCFNCNNVLVHHGICPHGPKEVARTRKAVEMLSAASAEQLAEGIYTNKEFGWASEALFLYASVLEGKTT